MTQQGILFSCFVFDYLFSPKTKRKSYFQSANAPFKSFGSLSTAQSVHGYQLNKIVNDIIKPYSKLF